MLNRLLAYLKSENGERHAAGATMAVCAAVLLWLLK